MTTNRNYATPMLVVGCVLFGLGSLIVKFVPVGGYAIAFWRLLIASFVFYGLMKWKKQTFPKNRKALWFGIFSGVFLAFDLAFWHESIYAVGPGISTLLNSLQIFFLATIGFFFFAERQSKLQLLSLLLAVAGVVMITGDELQHNMAGIYGVIIGLLSAAMLAASMVMIKQVHQTEKTALFPLMFIISLSGAVALIFPSLLLNAENFYPTSWKDWGLILIYGAIMQCVAWGMIAYAIPYLSLSLTGLLLLSEPVIALVIDAFYLEKAITLWQWSGAGITLLAIYLGSLKNQHS